ncbi:CHASE2 domain-containing protein [Melaminivora sp.]
MSDAGFVRIRQFSGAHHGLWREWCVLALLLLALVAWLTSSGLLRRADFLAHDATTGLRALPANPDIVLISVDDASIAAIGRWPWRRALHAQVVTQIAAQAPRALALDMLFGEPDADYPGDDLLLARALQQAGNAVLPVARRAAPGQPADLPLAGLRQAAAQLGHVQVQVDADGAVRQWLALEGPQAGPWPHFSVALLCAAGQARPGCRGQAAPAAGPWVRQGLHNIIFASRQPGFTHYSYIDLLKGRLPPDALRGKYVLLGASATGLGDMLATPAAGPQGRIAGVELLAHILNAELAGARLQPAPDSVSLLLNLLPVLIALLTLLFAGPLASLLGCAMLALASTLLATLALPLLLGWQPPIAPALAGIALAYPLWSWRRLSAAAHFLQAQMQQLRQQLPLAALPGTHLPGDALERRIAAVESASGQLRQLHQFVSESLQHLPLPTLVCAGAGQVLLANEAAAVHLQRPLSSLPGQPLAQLLADLTDLTDPADPAGQRPLLTPDSLSGAQALRLEGRDAQGRDLLALCQPHQLEGARLWLVSLVDLSAIRSAQRQRDQALHFISHDIRAPAASILTLLELQREFPGHLPEAELLARIERQAQASLSMAQGFVRLASAQADPYQRQPFDLAATLQEACDDIWAQARQQQISVQLEGLPEQALVLGDRSLILRAIGNLLGNALKFSPAGQTVQCRLLAQQGDWRIDIQDAGPGIPAEQQARIFQPFVSLPSGSAPSPPKGHQVGGVGLGLAFVQTVLQRHHGRVQVSSPPEGGACFSLLLPMLDPARQAGG